MPCVQCGRPPVAAYELPGGQQVNLCFRHMQEFEAMKIRQIELYQHLVETAEANIAGVFGLLRSQRAPCNPSAQTPRVDVRQINITGDILGVVNAGTAGNIANGLSVLRDTDVGLADRFKDLTEAITRSPELDPRRKREALELLGELVEDAAGDSRKRRSPAVMHAIASGLGHVLSHVADLYTLWGAIEAHLGWK